MPGIYNLRLTDALVQVGPTFAQLQGFGDDMFTLAPSSDVGLAMGGVQGDTMHVQRLQNLWTFTITTLVASSAITLLSTLHETLGLFPFKCSYGDFNLQGFMSMTNLGEMAAGLGATTRTMTGGVSKVSGNTLSSPGTLIQII